MPDFVGDISENGSGTESGTDGGAVAVHNAGAIAVGGVIAIGPDGGVDLSADGMITEAASGSIQTKCLTTASRGGQVLTGVNRLDAFAAVNTGGAIELTNTVDLTLLDLEQPDGGDVSVECTGSILLGSIQTALGVVTLQATGSIQSAYAAGATNIQAAGIDLTAGGGIGVVGTGGEPGGGGDGGGDGGGENLHDHGLHLGRWHFGRPLYGPWRVDLGSGVVGTQTSTEAPVWWFDDSAQETQAETTSGGSTESTAAPLLLDSAFG